MATGFTITVQDQAVQTALQALLYRVNIMQPVLQTIGEGIVERTKARFDTSTAPDGTPWTPNSAVTLAMLAQRLAGTKSNRKKNGDLNARGQRAYANKKILVDSGFLRQQIVATASGSDLTVTATAKYAANQQFGGQAGRGKKVTIPSRPFLPIRQDGSLYPEEQEQLLDAINAYLAEGLE